MALKAAVVCCIALACSVPALAQSSPEWTQAEDLTAPPLGIDAVAPDYEALPLALGLELGEASGLSAAYRWRDRHEVAALLGYSPLLQSVVLRTDYLFHIYQWMPSTDYGIHLDFFAGAGARLGLFEPRPVFWRELPFALGGRVPIGVVAALPPMPAELVLCVAPGADVLPELRFHTEGSVALRFRMDPRVKKPLLP